jgi:gliding motility-associated-like protein
MNAVVVSKTKGPWCKLIFTSLLLLFALYANAQNECDGNCTADGCQPDTRPLGTKIERGCECFDGIDNDGDNKIDKADPNCASYYGLTYIGEGSDCSLPIPEGNPFTGITFSGASSQNTADTQSKVSVGDVDGDGIPDAVITSKWNQNLTVVATRIPQPDGTKLGAAKSEFKLTGQGAKLFQGTGDCAVERLMYEHENLIADIDKDGKAEIFAVVSNRNNAASIVPPKCFYLVGFQYKPNTLELLPGWGGKAVPIGTDRPGTFGIADMDGDGKAEIYLRDRIYAAETGALLAKADGNWDLDVSAGPVAVDIAHLQNDNGKMELVVGNRIYGIPNLSNRNPATPASLTLLKDMNTITPNKWFVKMSLDPVEYGEDTHSMLSVGDINRDGNIDVVLSGALNGVNGKTTVFYWDVKNDFVSHFVVPDPAYTNGWPWGTGRVNIGDADGDGDPELTFMAGNRLFCMSIDAGGNMTNLWGAPRIINDSRSGVLTVTIYDFDSDGNPEMVYRDSQELVIIDGKTGQNKLWSTTCQSHTYTEGPIIADVNGDGVTDICVTCYTGPGLFEIDAKLQQQALGQIRLFYSTSEITWTPTRKVWNQPGYFVVNINDDLTLPFPQLAQNMVFEGGTCSQMITGPLMRMNVFLNQIPFLTSSGCPIMPAPDLAILPILDPEGNVITPAVEVIPPICGDYAINARFNIQNIGDLPITDNIPVSFFNGDPYDPVNTGTLLHTTTLNLVNLGVDATFTSPWITFNGPGYEFPMYVVLNTNGAVLPLDPNGTVTNECKINNNHYVIQVIPTPYTVTTSVTANSICSPTDAIGEARVATILKGNTETTDWSVYDFQWYDGPAAGPYTIRDGDTNYNLTGLTAGTYTVIATHKTIGCSSAPVEAVVDENVLAIPFTIEKISDQTQCSPFNGAVALNFAGADLTGVTILWRDEDSGTTIAENVTSLTGLKGSPTTYSATVTRGTCVAIDQVTILPPDYPSGVAIKVRDVMDCLNPQSGKVTAFAQVLDPNTGAYVIDQDTSATKYRFTWYNFVNNVRQSPIPNQPVNGPTAWGLPEGSYEVVVTNLLTNCTSVDPVPPVTIEKGYTLPTADVQRLRPQTACSGDGNAALLGIAMEFGAPAADPSHYDYFWYEGLNTITRLQDTNGNTYNNPTLDAIAGGVRGGNLAYTVEVVHKVTGCSATAYNTAEEIINYPIVDLAKTDNDVCPNTINLPYNGAVSSSVTFASDPVSDFGNYQFRWYTGSVVNEANRIPDTNTVQSLQNLQGGQYTLVVEETVLRCPSIPVNVQVLDILGYPQLTSNVDASTNCTNPPVPNGAAYVVTINTTTVPDTGILAPFSFQWYNGTTPAPGNEVAGAGNVGFLKQLAGSNDPSLANYSVVVINNNNGCSTPLSFHIPDNRVLPGLTLTPTPNTNCAEGDGILYTGKVDAVLSNQIGDVADYTFTWTNAALGTRTLDGQPGLQWPNLAAGTYNLKVVHNATGCESPLSSAIVTNVTTPPVIDPIANGSTNCAPFKPGNGSVAVVSMDNGAPLSDYSFQWYQGQTATGTPITTQPATTNTLQGAPDAYYTVLVRKLSNNCENTAIVQVPDLSALPVIALEQDPNQNCAAPFNGAARVQSITYKGAAYANAANIQYAWYDGNGTATPRNPQVNNAQLSLLEGNLYYSATVTMIDEGCTSDVVAIQVTNDFLFPEIDPTIVGSLNCEGGTPDGSVSVVASPAASYEYRWYNGGTVVPGSELNTDLTLTSLSGLQGANDTYYTVEVKSPVTRCASTRAMQIPDLSQIPVISPLTGIDNTNCLPRDPNGQVIFNGFTYRGGAVPSPYTGFTFQWASDVAGVLPETGDALNNKPEATYSLQITHVAHNCKSDPVVVSIQDDLDYPVISTVPTPQTSCDTNNPNGQIVATVGGATAGYSFDWTGPDGVVGETVEGTTTRTLRSGSYQVSVENTTNGCVSTQAILLPDQITYPVLAFTNVNPNNRCDTPDGSATPTVTGLSVFPPTNQVNYTIFYAKTLTNDGYPTDKNTIENLTSANGGLKHVSATDGLTPADVTGLRPGYVTGFVRDLHTTCESQITTIEIEDATLLVQYQFESAAKAGLCDGLGGGINVTVSGGSGGTLEYRWYKATPLNTNINFYNNPPDMGGSPVVNTNILDEDLGDPDGTPVGGVGAGVYTLVVSDLGNGCGAYFIENVPLTTSPEFEVTGIDNTHCVTPNGSIEVKVTQNDPTLGPYSVVLRRGNGPTGAIISGEICDEPADEDGNGLTNGADPSCNNGLDFTVTFPNLPEGEYFVQLFDYFPVNRDCPQGKGEVLLKKAFNPILAAQVTTANTTCSEDGSGDGAVSLTATPSSQDATVPNYQLYEIAPDPSSFPDGTTVALTPNVPSAPITGFGPTTYTFNMRDLGTGCEATTSITIPDQPKVPEALDVTATPDTYCFPKSNGQLQVISVAPGAVADYDYTWANDVGMTDQLYTGPELVYNSSSTGWKSAGQNNLGNGDQVYYVRGIKRAGEGQGCPTPTVMRVVNDRHVTPATILTSRPNTSCVDLVNEGFITVTASTDSPEPAIAGAMYTYSLDNGAFTTPQNGGTPFMFASLSDQDGTPYTITAINEENACLVQNTIVIQDSKFVFAITKNDVADQLICNADGEIEVTEVVLDRTLTGEGNIQYTANLTNDFSFSWFRAPQDAPGTFDSNAPLSDDNSDVIGIESLMAGTAATQYSQMGAGTYYVIATRSMNAPGAGCTTAPYRVDVLDKHINPTIALTPFTNTSCSDDPIHGEGMIEIRVTGDTPNVTGPFTYEYTWAEPVNMPNPNVNNGDGSSADGDNDNPTGLMHGTYNLTVRNIQTGCEVTGVTTINKNETPVFLTSAIPLPQELCFNSGSIEVTKVEVLTPLNVREEAPLQDFTYTWVREGATVLEGQNDILLNNVTYPDITAGTYYVTATRTADPASDGGPGYGCSSAPYRVDILERINYANVTIVPFANTACTEDENFFEGSATITVTETGVGSGATYEYTWTAEDPANTSLVLTQAPKPTGPGTADLQEGLRDDRYFIAVFNQTTGCTVDAETNIIKTSIPVIITEAGTTPKPICLPSGSAFVTKVLVDGGEDPNFNNFDFTWSEATLENVVINAGQGVAVLDNVSYPTVTQNSLTYYVSATRRTDALNPDNTPAIGRGCSSPPVVVTIQDQSLDPTATFALAQNTSCNDLAPNGSIIATASDPSGSTDFTFTWSLDGGPIPGTAEAYSNGVENGWNKALEGTYTLLLYNVDTGCDVELAMNVELNQRASFPNIIEVIPTSPIDCNNSGSALVTRIYIGNDQTDIPGTDPRFTYTWYTEYTDKDTNTPINGEIEEEILNRGPGRYFVTVMDTFEDRNCPSGPNQVEIDDPIANYPVPMITQSLPQISCRPGEGTAQLNASASGPSAADHVFSWYTGLDAADGNEILDQNNNPITGALLDNVDDGHYSVKVYNTTTNCMSTTYFIVEDKQLLYYPQIQFASAPRTSCVDPNGVLEAREVGFNLLNTTNPSLPDYYRFAPDYSADYFLGSKEQAGTDFDNDMPQGNGFDQTTNRVWSVANRDALEIYTVKITDENTGCFVIEEVQIMDKRENPVVDIIVENPLINCYINLPNGQLTATADGKVGGYEFTWYGGQAVDPARLLYTGDKLIGAGAAMSPDLNFTVQAVNLITGCLDSKSIVLPDSRVEGETPVAITIQDDTRCDADDGWVTAHVNNETYTHNFYWFNGNITTTKGEGDLIAADHKKPDYLDLPANTYTVYAQNVLTGCISRPVPTIVRDVTVIPELIFKVTASFCEDVPNEHGGGIGNGTIELTLDPPDAVADDVRWTKEVDLTDAGTGNFVAGLYPGWYSVDLVTTKGCPTAGRALVPTDIKNYNLVTQNSDGKNDIWVIDCISRFPLNNVKIFNRSGVLVYEADGYDNGDTVFEGIGKRGLYMTGNLLPVGTYFYIIDKRDGSKPRTGYLELVR